MLIKILMNKKEFINLLNMKINIPKNQLKIILDNAQELLVDLLLKGQKLNIKGFGSFSVKEKNERKYFNVYLNQVKFAMPKKVVVFKCNKKLI